MLFVFKVLLWLKPAQYMIAQYMTARLRGEDGV